MGRNYPAKILLFGEHTVLRGGQGLAIPYPARSIRWVKDKPDERLLQFSDYLKVVFSRHLLDTGGLEDRLLDDWRLAGDIPTGYGLGSSGAVCAAIWDQFATPAGKALTGDALRQALARMEQHFHGQSSGTDPLISLLNTPVLLGGGQPPQISTLPANWNEGFFLLDTGQERQAATLIRQFTTRYDEDADFARSTASQWLGPANTAIQALMAGNRTKLATAMRQVATFQQQELPDFIPASLRSKCLGDGYTLKLCGAGGGGMMLGLASDKAEVARQLGPVDWL